MTDLWNVLLPRQIHPAGPESIPDFADFESVTEVGTNTADLVRVIDRFDAVILRTISMNEEVISAADDLKVIAKHGAGVDNVDVAAASERNVVVCNTPGANARTVAEGAISILLATRRNLVQADRDVRAGNWGERENWDKYCRPTLGDDELGLFGFGNIAREVAALADGLGMTCITFDPYVPESDLPSHVRKVDSATALCSQAEAVSVHAPLTEESRGAIGAAELAELGPDGIVVNTARGPIIDEGALLRALEDGTILGAGLDTLASEPPSPDDPILQADNVVLSPHIAGLSTDATHAMSTHAADNVRAVYEGRLAETTINVDSITLSR